MSTFKHFHALNDCYPGNEQLFPLYLYLCRAWWEMTFSQTVFILLYLCRDLVVRWYFIYLLTDSVYYMLLPSVGSGVWWQLHGRPFFNNLHGGEHLWSPLSHSPLRQVWEEVGHSVVSMDTRGHWHSNSLFKQLYHVYSAKIFHRSTEYGKCAISMSVMFDFMIWYS